MTREVGVCDSMLRRTSVFAVGDAIAVRVRWLHATVLRRIAMGVTRLIRASISFIGDVIAVSIGGFWALLRLCRGARHLLLDLRNVFTVGHPGKCGRSDAAREPGACTGAEAPRPGCVVSTQDQIERGSFAGKKTSVDENGASKQLWTDNESIIQESSAGGQSKRHIRSEGRICERLFQTTVGHTQAGGVYPALDFTRAEHLTTEAQSFIARVRVAITRGHPSANTRRERRGVSVVAQQSHITREAEVTRCGALRFCEGHAVDDRRFTGLVDKDR